MTKFFRSVLASPLVCVSALFLVSAPRPASGATTILVSNLGDSGPGSLRQAILDNQNLGGGNAIIFSNALSGTITLTTGELLLSNNLTILGPGPNVLSIDGDNFSRVFHITNSTVSISGLTITNGTVKAPFGNDAQGGGILNNGTLSLSNCVITHSSVFGGDGAPAGNGDGGGIFNSGALTLTACSITANTCHGGNGGSYNLFTSANGGDGAGGGICNASGLLIASECTLNGNLAYGGMGGSAGSFGGTGGNADGGGIYNTNPAVGLVTNCTISINSCVNGMGGGANGPPGASRGGGISIISGSIMAEHCTISSNQLYNTSSGMDPIFPFEGAGVFNFFGSATNHNTIIAGNSAIIPPSPTSPSDVSGAFTSLGFNLIGKSDGSSGWISSDYTGTTASPLDPMLGPLTANGGSALTMAPKLGSPAIDNATAGGTLTDQRGAPRPFDFAAIPDAAGGDGSDIGAVELNPAILVTNTNNSGSGSLRQAILDASPASADIIAFAADVTGTILLTNGELVIGKNLVISGPGPSVLAVSGNSAGRVFDVTNGTVTIFGLTIRDGLVVGATGRPGGTGLGGGIYCGTAANLALAGCVISNCAAIGGHGQNGIGTGGGGSAGNAYGGGIINLGTLTLDRCWLVGNQASGGSGGSGGLLSGAGGNGGSGIGGGIYSQSANLALRSCTLSANRAAFGSGGFGQSGSGTSGTAAAAGLDNYGGIATLINSTIASNTVTGGGTGSAGGIYSSSGGVLLLACTVAGNNGDSSGGGIGGFGGGSATNTIIAGNTATSSPDLSGTFTSGGYNLIGNTTGSSGFGTTGDQLNVNPLLGPLRSNGGPTPTMALQASSPAIDKGNRFGLATDQRGAPRPFDFSSIANASGGDASDIGAFELVRPRLSLQILENAALLSWPNYYGDFSVQFSSNVTSNNWTAVPGTPEVVGSQYVITNGPLSGSRFYRLNSN